MAISRVRILFLVLFTSVFTTGDPACASEGESISKVRKDANGDPLPKGAIAPLGSVRWRTPARITLLRFLNERELLVGCEDGMFRVLDAETGKEVRRFGKREGLYSCVSPDGSTVAQASYVQGETDGKSPIPIWAGLIHIWDTRTGVEVRQMKLAEEMGTSGLLFINDKALLTWDSDVYRTWDIGTGKPARGHDLSEAFKQVGDRSTAFRISRDQSVMAFVLDTQEQPQRKLATVLFDVRASKELQRLNTSFPKTGEFLEPVFSPDGKTFAGSTGEGEIQLRSGLNFGKIRQLQGIAKGEMARGAAFSADGKVFSLLTRKGKIRLFRVETGEFIRKIGEEFHGNDYWYREGERLSETLQINTDPLSWSPDGKRLAQVWGMRRVRIWDVETGKSDDRAPSHVGNVAGLIVQEDGKSAITLGDDATIRKWNVENGKQERVQSLPNVSLNRWLLDENRVLFQAEDGKLYVNDCKGGKEVFGISKKLKAVPTANYTVSSDRRWLITKEDRTYSLFQTAFRVSAIHSLENESEHWLLKRDLKKAYLTSFAQSADGRIVVAADGDPVQRIGLGGVFLTHSLYCYRCGKDATLAWQKKNTTPEDGAVSVWAISSDNRVLLTCNVKDAKWSLTLLDTWTGGERVSFVFPLQSHSQWDEMFFPHAFSSSGDFVAAASDDDSVLVFNVRTSKQVACLNGDQGIIRSVAFAQKGEALFTGGSDGTMLVWDIDSVREKAASKTEWSEAERKRMWEDLASPDAGKAYRALGDLVSAPEMAMQVLRGKLKPIESVQQEEIDRNIRDLASEKFAAREAALRELKRISFAAIPALEQAQGKRNTLEQQRRIDALLAFLREREVKTSPEELRELRAIEVLEVIGTPETRGILESLAEGARGWRLTEEAVAAVQRQWGK